MQTRQANLWAALAAAVLAGTLTHSAAAEVARRAGSQEPVAQTSATPAAPAAEARAVILAAQGKVRFRPAADQPWKPAKVGEALAESGEIETGLKSAIRIRIGAAQVLTIDRASRVVLKEAIQTAGPGGARTDRTTVDLPYGRVAFDVASAGVANDVAITAPDATLAVRGTQGLMEVTAGFATVARGDDNNTGRFTVTNSAGQVGQVTSNETTNSQQPAPAKVEQTQTFVDTGNPAARQGADETNNIANASGGGENVRGTVIGGSSGQTSPPPPPPPPGDLFFIDRTDNDRFGDLITRTPSGEFATIRTGPEFRATVGLENNGPSALALLTGPDQPSTLLRLISRVDSATGEFSNRVLSLDLSQSSSVFREVGRGVGVAPEIPLLFSLGTLGSSVYAGGSRASDPALADLRHELFRLELRSAGVGVAIPVMSLPFLGGGVGSVPAITMTGSNAAGSLFVSGRTDFNSALGLLLGVSLFEVDPRSNLMKRVITLVDGPSTVRDQPSSLPSVTDVAVRGMAAVGDRIIMTVTSGNDPFLLVINPNAAGTRADPTIVSIRRLDIAPFGLAGNQRVNPAPATPLLPGSGTIDPALPQLFAGMAFTAVALSSPQFIGMVAGQVVIGVIDTSACAAFLATQVARDQLAAALLARAGQQAGVGRGVHDFRTQLPSGHPCSLGGGPLFFLDDALDYSPSDNSLNALTFAASISSRPNPGRPSFGNFPGGVSGIAQEWTPLGANSFGFAALALLVNAATFSQFRLVEIDLVSGLTVERTTFTLPNSPNGFVAGLAAINNRPYTQSYSFIAPNASTVTILDLGPRGTSPPAPYFEFESTTIRSALGSVNETASILATARARIDPSGSELDFILQITQVGSFVVRATPLVAGPNSILPQGLNINRIADVRGLMELPNGQLIVAFISPDLSGQFFAFVNPNAAGTPQDPTVLRVVSSPRLILGLAGQRAAVAPPPPALLATTRQIDTRTGSLVFNATAFSSQSLSFIVPMLNQHIIRNSRSPINCAVSSDLSLTSNLAPRFFNQPFGVGQTLGAFRDILPVEHACQLPDASLFAIALNDSGTTLFRLSLNGTFTPAGVPVTGLFLSTLVNNSGLSPSHTGIAIRDDATPNTVEVVRYVSTPTGPVDQTFLETGTLLPNGALNRNRFLGPVSGVGRTTGIATLGSNVFLASEGDGASPGQFGIFLVDPMGSTATSFFEAPGLGNSISRSMGLGSDTQRGTLWMSSDLAGFSLIEYDPAHNFIPNALSVQAAQLVPAPSTGGNASNVGPSVLSRVDGISVVNGRLLVSGRQFGGPAFLFNIDPNGVNGTSAPVLRRTDSISGSIPSIGSAAQRPLLTVPPPNLPNPGTPIDLRGLNARFADLAFSQRAVDSGVVSGMARAAVLSSARDPAGCSASGDLGSVDAFVQSRVNQRAGMGRAITDFRNALPQGHPCTPP